MGTVIYQKRSMNWVLRLSVVTIMLAWAAISLPAQDVTVTVTPVQQVLPPQVSLYITNPGKYFNIAITNNSQETQNVFLGMQLEQVTPSSGLSVTVPARRLPKQPYSIAPGQTHQLTMVEMKTMFNHVPRNEVMMTPGLFDSYTDGSFGLLPEGSYQAHLTAYRWDPTLANPLAVSNPNSGVCHFMVCYQAQAPQFILPAVMYTGGVLDALNLATLDPTFPQLTWTEPVVACNPAAAHYTYDVKIVEHSDMLPPDDAMDHNPVVYQVKNLRVPMAVIPQNIVNARFTKDKTYLAQVVAHPTSTRDLDFTMLTNDGKSTYRHFRVGQPDTTLTSKPTPKILPPQGGEGGDDGDDDGDNATYGVLGEIATTDVEGDVLYRFKNPEIREPWFESGSARKLFMREDIRTEWERPWIAGGEGSREDTIQFKYTVQIFKAKPGCNRDSLFLTEPLYKSQEQSQTSCYINWDKISSHVAANDYMLLRILPNATNESSVQYIEDKNVIDFTLCERLSSRFNCTATSNLPDNQTPLTTPPAKDTRVGLGQYDLIIIEAKQNKDQSLSGRGKVIWAPTGFDINVCVKFDSLFVNTDNIAYKGFAYTYAQDNSELGSVDQIEKIFSDWGLDNWVADTSIPFASQITESGKNLSEKVDIAKYYKYTKTAAIAWDLLSGKGVQEVYLPLKLPKNINPTPVDIQIASMKFEPTSAQMNLIGQMTMPDADVIRNEVLLFGAPRLCISPDRILPRDGHVCLLDNFILEDPDSKFMCSFKAPRDVMSPNDGCYIAWQDDQFEELQVDIDMQIPGLKYVDAQDEVVDRSPILNVNGRIRDWDNWILGATMEHFQVNNLPGYTFMAEHLVYDHSADNNHQDFKAETVIPTGYDKSWMDNHNEAWQGLWIGNIGVKLPKEISLGKDDAANGISDTDSDAEKAQKRAKNRLTVSVSNVLVDQSGFTLHASVSNVFSAYTGGWGISVKDIFFDMIQDKPNETGFKGDITVPLLQQDDGKGGKEAAKIDYVAKMAFQDHAGEKDYVLVFSTGQMKNISFDFFLATVTFEKDQTYFLLESDKHKTRVELCMGGNITIDTDLKVGMRLPGVKFSEMRVANCERWRSEFNEVAAKAYDAYMAKHKTDNNYETPVKDAEGSEEQSVDEASNADGSIRFDIGRWSFASPDKNVGGFGFTISDFSLVKGGSNEYGLRIGGELKMLDGKITAGTTISIFTLIDWDKKSIKYKDIKFNEATISSKGLAGLKLSGSFKVFDEEKKKGYHGDLEFELPGGLFSFKGAGDYLKVKKTAADLAKDMEAHKNQPQYQPDSTYVKAYLVISMSTSASALGIPPVALKGISGGFYFNCSGTGEISEQVKESYGCVGGMLGVQLATTGSDRAMNIDGSLCVVYDMYGGKDHSGQLSTIRVKGDLHALCAPGSDKGVVNASAVMLYINNETDKFFNISITVDAEADMSEMVAEITGEDITAWVPEAVQTGLGELGAGENDPNKNKVISKEDEKKNKEEQKAHLSAGLSVNLDFKITWREKGVNLSPALWHLWIGNPFDERCRLTLIDFSLGDEDDPVAMWATIGADAYLCVGTDMPKNSAGQVGLPPIPDEISKFLGLGATDINGNPQTAMNDIAPDRDAKEQQIKQFSGFTGGGDPKGGIMVGAKAYGKFGLNAGIVYARANIMLGFDFLLQELKKGTHCIGGGEAGKNGYYATGQVYGLIAGELGLMLNLWIYKGKISLIDVGLGSLLQGGFPNPTWVYGKARAKCRLFGGLIKFNHTIEIKAGEVCMPEFGNPLDDIKIFEDVQPGDENPAQGWAERAVVSANTQPRFTTNMVMDADLRLVDKNKAYEKAGWDEDIEMYSVQASRTYRFHLDKQMALETYGMNQINEEKPTATLSIPTAYHTTNHQSYSLTTGTLDIDQLYAMRLSGYAKEVVNGDEVDPVFNDSTTGYKDKNVPWSQTVKYYFRTSSQLPSLEEDVAVFNTDYADDLIRPTLALRRSHATEVNDPEAPLTARLEVMDQESGLWHCPDVGIYSTGHRGTSVSSGPTFDPHETITQEDRDRLGQLVDINTPGHGTTVPTIPTHTGVPGIDLGGNGGQDTPDAVINWGNNIDKGTAPGIYNDNVTVGTGGTIISLDRNPVINTGTQLTPVNATTTLQTPVKVTNTTLQTPVKVTNTTLQRQVVTTRLQKGPAPDIDVYEEAMPESPADTLISRMPVATGAIIKTTDRNKVTTLPTVSTGGFEDVSATPALQITTVDLTPRKELLTQKLTEKGSGTTTTSSTTTTTSSSATTTGSTTSSTTTGSRGVVAVGTRLPSTVVTPIADTTPVTTTTTALVTGVRLPATTVSTPVRQPVTITDTTTGAATPVATGSRPTLTSVTNSSATLNTSGIQENLMDQHWHVGQGGALIFTNPSNDPFTWHFDKDMTQSQFYAIPLEEIKVSSGSSSSQVSGDYIFLRTKNAIDKKYLEKGKQYRFTINRIESKKRDQMLNQLDSAYRAKKAQIRETTVKGKGETYTSEVGVEPSETATFNLDDYLDQFYNEMKDDMDEDSVEFYYLKFKDNLTLDNFTTQVYKRQFWTHASYESLAQHASQNISDFGTKHLARLKTINYNTNYSNKTDQQVLSERLYKKDPYIGWAYWADMAFISGYSNASPGFGAEKQTSLASLTLLYSSSPGVYSSNPNAPNATANLDNLLSMRGTYKYDGALIQSLATNLKARRLRLVPDMISNNNAGEYSYGVKNVNALNVAIQRAIEGDIDRLRMLYFKLQQQKEKFTKAIGMSGWYTQVLPVYTSNTLMSKAKKWINTNGSVPVELTFQQVYNGYGLDHTIGYLTVNQGDGVVNGFGSFSFFPYQVAAMYSYNFEAGSYYHQYYNSSSKRWIKTGTINHSWAPAPAWRKSRTLSQGSISASVPRDIWLSIDDKPTRNELWSNYKSFTYELFRQDAYHTKGHSTDNAYDVYDRSNIYTTTLGVDLSEFNSSHNYSNYDYDK